MESLLVSKYDGKSDVEKIYFNLLASFKGAIVVYSLHPEYRLNVAIDLADPLKKDRQDMFHMHRTLYSCSLLEW